MSKALQIIHNLEPAILLGICLNTITVDASKGQTQKFNPRALYNNEKQTKGPLRGGY